MITVREYIARKMPPRSFLSMPDVVNHILKHDTRRTVFKCPDTLDSDICFKNFVQSLKTPPETPKLFNSCIDEAYSPRRRHKEFDADSGDLDLDRYLNHEPRPFSDVFTIYEPRPARTILIDSCIPGKERNDEDTTEQHKAVYMEALKAEAEGTPLRVIACRTSRIDELTAPYTVYIVLKDWNDPIFPNIWGALKTSETTNDFGNCFQDYITGSHAHNNGWPRTTYYENDFSPDEEIILINPKRIAKSPTDDGTHTAPTPTMRPSRPRLRPRPRRRRRY